MKASPRALIVSLGGLAAALAAAVLAPAGSFVTFLAILSALILLPVSILLYIDYVRCPQRPGPAGAPAGGASLALKAPVVCFGVVAVGLGIAIAAWYLYNTFVERLPAYRDPPWFVGYGVAPAMIAFGWHLIRHPSSHYQ